MPGRMTEESAATLALKALAFLTLSPDDMGRFLGGSGLDVASLRTRADEPEIQVAVLDFLLTNEALLVSFCEADSIPPRDVHVARYTLGGP
jgi:hypothetical protein